MEYTAQPLLRGLAAAAVTCCPGDRGRACAQTLQQKWVARGMLAYDGQGRKRQQSAMADTRFIFATGMENSSPTIRHGKQRVDVV